MATGGRIKGITIEIGGDTTSLQKSLKDVDNRLKTTQNQLKDVNKLLKLDPSNTNLLKQKQDALNKAIKDTKSRLTSLKDAYKQLKSAPQTEEVIRQQQALEREIAETEQNLKSLKSEMKDFGNVAKQQLTNVGNKFNEVGDKLINIGQSMTTKVTLPIVAGFTLAANAASDYEENLNKLDVAFGEYADTVRDFTDNAYLDFGLSKVDASGMASAFGALAKGIGLADDQAAEMAVDLTGLSADLASYFNTDVETAGKALEAIFTGNSQSLKQFGVVITDVNLKEFAETLGMTSKEYANLSSQDKALLRFQYVMSQTSDAQGDFSRTNDGLANSSKAMKAALQDLATAIGTKLLPIITPVIQKITEVIAKINDLDPSVFEMIVKIGGVVAAIGPLIVIIGSVIKIAGALLTAIGAVVGVLGGPVTAVIAAVIAAGVWLWKNWATIEQKADELRTKILNVFSSIKDIIVEKIDAAKNFVHDAVEKIKNMFNFEWSLPMPKIPKFTIEGGVFPYGLGGKGKFPQIDVVWHRKAMENGMILNSPTIFGYQNGKFLGAGEAGSETIVGTNSLMRMIAAASGNGMTVNMTVNGGNVSANELADLVIDKLTNQIKRNNQRW